MKKDILWVKSIISDSIDGFGRNNFEFIPEIFSFLSKMYFLLQLYSQIFHFYINSIHEISSFFFKV